MSNFALNMMQRQINIDKQRNDLLNNIKTIPCVICALETPVRQAMNFAKYADRESIPVICDIVRLVEDKLQVDFYVCSELCRKEFIKRGFISYGKLMGFGEDCIVPRIYYGTTLEKWNNPKFQAIYDNINLWLNSPNKGWIFCGDTGTGKSSLAAAIVFEFRKLEKRVLFKKAVDFKIMLHAVSRSYKKQDYADCVSYYIKNDLLVLDDFDIFECTNDVFDLAYSIFSSLWENEKTIILTANGTMESIEKHQDPRIWSRIKQMCKVRIFAGKDLRQES
jgi:hypothetical protein